METTTAAVVDQLPESAGHWPWIPVVAIVAFLWVIAYGSRTRLPYRKGR